MPDLLREELRGDAHATVELLKLYEEHLRETKQVGTVHKYGSSLDRQLASGLAATVDPNARGRRQKRLLVNRQRLASMIARLGDSLVKVYRRYKSGDISLPSLRKMLQALLLASYRQAMGLGLASSESNVHPDMAKEMQRHEQEWLDSFRQEEHGYLERLIYDIRHGTSRQPVEVRLRRYARTVNSVFDSARLLTFPPNALIYWRTHSAAPCAGCTTLERHGPYTIMTLVAVPKSGASPCLDNCKCTLEVKLVTPEKAIEVARRNIGRERFLKILARVKRTRKPA